MYINKMLTCFFVVIFFGTSCYRKKVEKNEKIKRKTKNKTPKIEKKQKIKQKQPISIKKKKKLPKFCKTKPKTKKKYTLKDLSKYYNFIYNNMTRYRYEFYKYKDRKKRYIKANREAIKHLACACFNQKDFINSDICGVYYDGVSIYLQYGYSDLLKEKFIKKKNKFILSFKSNLNLKNERKWNKYFCKNNFWNNCSIYADALSNTLQSFKKNKSIILKSLEKYLELKPTSVDWYFTKLKKYVKKGYLTKNYLEKQLDKYEELIFKTGKVSNLMFDRFEKKLKKKSIPIKTAIKYFNYLRRKFNYHEYTLGIYEKLLKKYPKYYKYDHLITRIKTLDFRVDDKNFQDPELLSCGVTENEYEFYRYLDYCVLEKEYKP